MKLFFILFWFLLISTMSSIAQSSTDSLFIKKSKGVAFYQHGEPLKGKELKGLMKTNYAAYVEWWKARSNKYASYALALSGTYLLGWELGSGLVGDKVNISNAAIGAGMCLLAYACNRSGGYYAEQAVILYNRGLLLTEGQRMMLHFGLNKQGVGIRLIF